MTDDPHLPARPLLVGCGYTGRRLAGLLGNARALVRSTTSREALAAQGVAARALDLDRDPLDLAELADADALVLLQPPGGTGREDLRMARLLAGLAGVRPGVVVYLSSTGVYGDRAGAAVDEATPPRPGSDGAWRRLDAEARVAAWCADRGARAVVLRVAAIYGPHRLPLERLQRGEPVVREADATPGNRLHVDDLVAACRAALVRPVEGVVNAADGHPESAGAFTRRVAALAGLPAPRDVSWTEAQAQLSPGLLAFLRESRIVENRRLVGELGVTPRLPEQGIRESLAEMGFSSAAR